MTDAQFWCVHVGFFCIVRAGFASGERALRPQPPNVPCPPPPHSSLVPQGVLKGVDMQTTLVLSECRERIFSEGGGVEEVALGLYIVRGDQLCVLAEVDEEADAAVDWAATRGCKPEPILVGVL